MHAILFALLLIFASPLAAQEKTYDLSLDTQPKKGQKSKVSETSHMKISMLVNGEEAGEASEERTIFEATELVVETDGKGTGEVHRTYHKAQRLDQGVMRPFRFQGKAVKVKHVKGQPDSFSYLHGGNLTAEDYEALKESFSGSGESDEANPLEPPKKLRVGESWSPDVMAVAEMFDPEMAQSVDVSKSSSRFTLRSVEKRGGSEFGKVDGHIKLALNRIGPIDLDTPINMTMTLALDACVDDTSPDGIMKRTMKMQGPSTTTISGVQVKLDVDMIAESVMSRTTIE